MIAPPETYRKTSGKDSGATGYSTISAKLLSSHPALLASFFLAAGIAAGRGLPEGKLDPQVLGTIDSFAVSALIAIFFAIFFWSSSTRRKLLLGFAFVAGIALIWRHDHQSIASNDISNLTTDSKTEITLRVTAMETFKPYTVRYMAEAKNVAGSVATGKVWWYAAKRRTKERFLPGDIVTITGARLKTPRGFHNIGGWNYERYLFDRRIRALIFLSSTSTVRLVTSDFHWRRPIERIKSVMRSNLTFENNMVTAIGRATLTGDQGLLTPSMRDGFSQTLVFPIFWRYRAYMSGFSRFLVTLSPGRSCFSFFILPATGGPPLVCP